MSVRNRKDSQVHVKLDSSSYIYLNAFPRRFCPVTKREAQNYSRSGNPRLKELDARACSLLFPFSTSPWQFSVCGARNSSFVKTANTNNAIVCAAFFLFAHLKKIRSVGGAAAHALKSPASNQHVFYLTILLAISALARANKQKRRKCPSFRDHFLREPGDEQRLVDYALD